MVRLALASLAACLTPLAACSQTTDPNPGDPGPDGSSLDAGGTCADAAGGVFQTCPANEGEGATGYSAPDGGAVIGTFKINLAQTATAAGTARYTEISGKVSDGPQPAVVLWSAAQASGECVLLVPAPPFCSIPCGDAVCVGPDTCEPYPTAQDVGAVAVSGVHTLSCLSGVALARVNGGYQYLGAASRGSSGCRRTSRGVGRSPSGRGGIEGRAGLHLSIPRIPPDGIHVYRHGAATSHGVLAHRNPRARLRPVGVASPRTGGKPGPSLKPWPRAPR
jgi:hypothetical protein